MGNILKSSDRVVCCCCLHIRRRFREQSTPVLSTGDQQTSPCRGKHAPAWFFLQCCREHKHFPLIPRIFFHRSRNVTSKQFRTMAVLFDATDRVRLAECEKMTSGWPTEKTVYKKKKKKKRPKKNCVKKHKFRAVKKVASWKLWDFGYEMKKFRSRERDGRWKRGI